MNVCQDKNQAIKSKELSVDLHINVLYVGIDLMLTAPFYGFPYFHFLSSNFWSLVPGIRTVTLTKLQRSSAELGELGRRTNILVTLHQSGLYDRIVRHKLQPV